MSTNLKSLPLLSFVVGVLGVLIVISRFLFLVKILIGKRRQASALQKQPLSRLLQLYFCNYLYRAHAL